MDYIAKIVINDSLELYNKPFDSDSGLELSDVTYITNTRLKDSTSLFASLAFGGVASNTLYFNIVNPDVNNYESYKIQLFLKGADTGNLPLGNQRTDNGEFSLDVTPSETVTPTFDNTDPDAIDVEPVDEVTDEIDLLATDEYEESVESPEVFGAEDVTEPVTGDDSDNAENDPFFDIVDDSDDTEENPEEQTAWSPYGVYYVQSSMQNNDSGVISIEANDAVVLLGSAHYYPTQNSIPADEMFDDFITQVADQFGIEVYCNVTIPDVEVTMPNNVSFRDALGYFAGLTGGYATTDVLGDIVISPYEYSNAEVHSDVFMGKGFVQEGQNAIEITGLVCDTLVGLEENLITAGDGTGVAFENPLMTEDVLNDYVWVRVRNLVYWAGELQCKWNTSIKAGQFLKIFTPEDDAYRNALIAQLEGASSSEQEELLSEIQNCGRYIINTNQTIDFDNGVTVISSLGRNSFQQSTSTATSDFKKLQRVGTLLADRIEASMVETEALIAQKADINFANVIEASIGTEWVQKLLVHGNVIANNGTVYELDAIHFNTNFIEAGSIKADKLILKNSTDGLYYQLNINADGFDIDALTEEERAKLPDSLHADVIMANTITTKHITVQNLEGTNGWINLAEGTFRYINQNGNGISWDGNELYIRASKLLLEGGQSVEEIISEVWNDYNIVWTGVYDDTELTGQVYVYHYGEDVTDQFSDAIFSWVRRTDYGNQLIASGTKTFTYDQANTMISDTFVLQWYDEMEIELADDNGDTILVTENGTDYTELIGKEGIS